MSGWWGITRRFVYIYLHASLPINQTLCVLIRSTIPETLIRVKLEVYASKNLNGIGKQNKANQLKNTMESYYSSCNKSGYSVNNLTYTLGHYER